MSHDADYPYSDQPHHTPGTALAPASAAAQALSDSQSPPPPPPEILAPGLDPVWLMHSFRRRWVLAVGIGLLIGAIAAVSVWALIPARASATALLKVRSVKPHILKPINEGESDFDTYRRTLSSLITARPVLQMALNKGDVSRLPSIAGVEEENKVNWLRDQLTVTFANNAEVMSVSMAGEEPQDLVQFVDAVVDAFLREVVYKERDERLQNRDLLKKSYDRAVQQIEAKTSAYYKLARDLYAFETQPGGGDRSLAFKEVRSLAATELNVLREEMKRLERELFNVNFNLKVFRARRDDPQLVDAAVEQMLQEDPQVQLLQDQLTSIELLLSEELSRSRRPDAPSIVRFQRQRESIRQRLAQRESALRPQLQFQIATAPDAEFTSSLKQAQMRKSDLETRLTELRADHVAQTEELKRLGERSLELDMRKEELDQLKRVAREMGGKIEALDIEINLPDRVTPIQTAEIKPGLNRLQRSVLVGFGGFMGFAFTCFGIAFWELQSRRLNDAQQVDQGLGLPVIGELPPLSGSGMLDRSDPRVAMLLEAADRIRATLMNMNHGQKPRVIMVTSASGGEGCTAVASQLAASLARAGQRTILVDGDVRHPSLHRLFDRPLEGGMCEVLRGEARLDEVVRETGADRLWLLSAGMFDEASIQAMGQDRIGPIIEQLRAEFQYVIIDAAPVLSMADSLILGGHTDGTLVSVLKDVSRVPQVFQAAERLRRVNIRILGAVVNGVARPIHDRALRLGFTAPPESNESLPVKA